MSPSSNKKNIQLIHWNVGEAKTVVEKLEDFGYTVQFELPQGSNFLKQMEEIAPAAVVISLSRLPAQGRDMAMLIRKRKGTRFIPIVFLEGEQEKVKEIQKLLPDAIYASWNNVSSCLEKAIAHPLKDPVVPESVFDAYKGKPLNEKLGIKSKSIVALINEPQGFRGTLKNLTEDVKFLNQIESECNLIIWFVKSQNDLGNTISNMFDQIHNQSIWIAWPKKTSAQKSDLSQTIVRKTGLAAGLVDFKICSIDETWSGLLFRKRKANE